MSSRVESAKKTANAFKRPTQKPFVFTDERRLKSKNLFGLKNRYRSYLTFFMYTHP